MNKEAFDYQMLALECTINRLQKIAEEEKENIDVNCRKEDGSLDIDKYMCAVNILGLIKGMTAAKNAISYMQDSLFGE